MDFVQDDRLTITAPTDQSTIRLPGIVRWKIRDFTVTGPGGRVAEDAGYFAVFLDRPPIGVGENVNDLGKEDPTCQADPRCPDLEYLHRLAVYPTSSTQVTIDTVPVLGADQTMHTAWVVLLDSSGKRVDEAQWKVSFDVRVAGEVDR